MQREIAVQRSLDAGVSLLSGTDVDSRLLGATFSLSLLIHILAALAMFFLPHMGGQSYQMPSAMYVNLVSLNPSDSLNIPEGTNTASGPEAVQEHHEASLVTAEDSEVVSEAPVEPETAPVAAERVVTPEPPVSPPQPREEVVVQEGPKPQEKVERKPDPEQTPAPVEKSVKTIKPKPQAKKPENAVEKAVKPEALRSESIKEAINRIRQKVGDKDEGSSSGTLGVRGGSGTSGGFGGFGGTGGGISDIYKAQLSYQIERNWAFSEHLARGERNLKTVLFIRILPGGDIQDIWFEKRSGNAYLDDSAYKAVEKSNPLPPLPKGYKEYTIGLVFTPSGLN